MTETILPSSIYSKEAVKSFWERGSCGERLYLTEHSIEAFKAHSATRYRLEPYIVPFAEFPATKGKRVLEIGVGLGADHQSFAESGADLFGIDLTQRAVENTQARFRLLGLHSNLRVADAENLPFRDNYFDVVYSWGVLHCTPNTPKAFSEVLRVLKPGGTAKIMIYHKFSITGYMLWIRYALMRLRPCFSLKQIYAEYLESPGTKAYTVAEARALCSGFVDTDISTVLCHGDLLESPVGQRHRGAFLTIGRKILPRWLIRRFMSAHGLFLLIHSSKPLMNSR